MELKFTEMLSEIPEIDSPDLKSKSPSKRHRAVKILSEPSSPVTPALAPERKVTRQLDPAIGKIRQILLREKRSREDGLYLFNKFKQFQFFHFFNLKHSETLDVPEALGSLCRVMKMETYPPDTPIFKAGDLSNYKFFMVLSGEVHLYKNQRGMDRSIGFKRAKTQVFDDGPDTIKESTFRRSKRHSTIKTDFMILKKQTSSNSIDFDAPNEQNFLIRDDLRYIESVHRGATLGPNDMDDYEDIRESSAYTGDTKCDILYFTIDDLEYLKIRYAKNNSQLFNFLIDNIPELDKSLRTWNINKIESLFREENFQLHNYINVEGSKGKTIYLIYEGNCEISKNFKVPAKDSLARGNKINREISICIMSSGALIGEEILYNKEGIYDYNVKVTSSKAKLVAIDKEIFCTRFPFRVQEGVKRFSKIRQEQNLSILAAKQENIRNLLPILEFAQSPRNKENNISNLTALPEVRSPARHTKRNSEVILTNGIKSPDSKKINPVLKNYSRKQIVELYNVEEAIKGNKKLIKSPSTKSDISGIKSNFDDAKLQIENYKFDFGLDEFVPKKPQSQKNIELKYKQHNKENYEKHLHRVRNFMSPTSKDTSTSGEFRELFLSPSKSPNINIDWIVETACPISIQRYDNTPKSSNTPTLPILSARSKLGNSKLEISSSNLSIDESGCDGSDKKISSQYSPRLLNRLHKKQHSIKITNFNPEPEIRRFMASIVNPIQLTERPTTLRIKNN